MLFTICAACTTTTAHDKRSYVYISILGIAQYCIVVFCSFLMQWIPPTLLRYFLSDFDNIPIATAVTVITFVLTFHISCIYYIIIIIIRELLTSSVTRVFVCLVYEFCF